MQPTTRRAISGSFLLAGIAGLAALGTVRTTTDPLTPVADGSPAAPAAFETSQDEGRIVIATDPGGELVVTYVDGQGDVTVIPLSPSKSDKCVVTPFSDEQSKVREYLDLEIVDYTDDTADGETGSWESFDTRPAIGLVDNGIGSSDGKNCNRSNARVENGEALRIALGSRFSGTDIKFDRAALDVEGKFGAEIEVIAGGDYFPALINGSDNDADAGGSDNDLITIGTPGTGDDFTSIVIAPVSDDLRGELSVEGGGDFTTLAERELNRTVLYLGSVKTYEYTLVCETNNEVYGPNAAVIDGVATGLLDGSVQGIDESVDLDADWSDVVKAGDYPAQMRVFRYADPSDPDKECVPIGADLEGEGGNDMPNTVLLEPSDDIAFLRAEITWYTPVPDESSDGSQDGIPASGEPLDRQIDIDGDGTQFGLSDPIYCTGIDVTDPFDPSSPGVVTHPDDTPWCVVSDVRQLMTIGGVEVVKQTMIWDGLGDPRWA